MKTKTYTVTGKSGANLRALPSSSAQIVKHLNKGDKADVVIDFKSTNTAGNSSTTYICIKDGNRFYWAAEGNFSDKTEAKKTEKIDFRAKVVAAAKDIYPQCIGKVHGGKNVKLVVSLATMLKYRALSCNRIASIVMQAAGLLDKGFIISHTPKRDGKKTIADAVSNYKKLKNCEVVWVNKLYKDLPDKYKKAGCIYFQNSNACVSVGNNHIFSCNKRKLYKYKSKSDYDRTNGYPFTSKILVVVVPNH